MWPRVGRVACRKKRHQLKPYKTAKTTFLYIFQDGFRRSLNRKIAKPCSDYRSRRVSMLSNSWANIDVTCNPMLMNVFAIICCCKTCQKKSCQLTSSRLYLLIAIQLVCLTRYVCNYISMHAGIPIQVWSVKVVVPLSRSLFYLVSLLLVSPFLPMIVMHVT